MVIGVDSDKEMRTSKNIEDLEEREMETIGVKPRSLSGKEKREELLHSLKQEIAELGTKSFKKIVNEKGKRKL